MRALRMVATVHNELSKRQYETKQHWIKIVALNILTL